jgi:intracellular sulfur oxidation DsrE/DsrF family protein
MDLDHDEPYLFHNGAVSTVTEADKLIHADEKQPDPSYALLPVVGGAGRIVVALSDDQIGMNEREHGMVLLRIFMEELCDRVTLPDEVVFYHRGVLLLDRDHPAQLIVRQLCSLDVEIKVCMESLDFYKIEPAAHNMQPVPMSEITRDLLKADKVIRP